MLVLLLKLTVDICWYLSVISPLLLILPAAVIWLVCFAPIVYVIHQICKQPVYSHGANMDVFLQECKVILAAALVEIAFAGPATWIRLSGIWTFLFLTLGILLMRVSRLGEKYQKDRMFWMWNGVYLLGTCLSAAVLTSKPFLNGVLWLLKQVYLHLIMPILLALLSALGWVLNIVVQLFVMLLPEGKATLEKLFDLQRLGEQPPVDPIEGMREFPAPIKIILIVIVFVVFLAALWVIYKKLTNMGRKRGQTGNMTKTWLVDEKKDASRGRILQKEEKSVRAFYQKFLRICLKAELPVTASKSSEEIQEMATALWQEEELSPLRGVYIKARYSGKDVEKEDVEKAKEEYRKLKRQYQRKKTTE